MCVERRIAATVADDDGVAVAGSPPRREHHAIVGRKDQIARVAVEIDAVVRPGGAEDRVHTRAERACQGAGRRPVRDREIPRGWGWGGVVGSLLLGQALCFLLCEAPGFLLGQTLRFRFGGDSRLLLEATDLLTDQSIRLGELVGSGLPLGDSLLHLDS